jgi:hypothetical protein
VQKLTDRIRRHEEAVRVTSLNDIDLGIEDEFKMDLQCIHSK